MKCIHSIDDQTGDLSEMSALVLGRIKTCCMTRSKSEGRKPSEQPHHFDVAASLTLEPAARMHTVEIPANIEPYEHTMAYAAEAIDMAAVSCC